MGINENVALIKSLLIRDCLGNEQNVHKVKIVGLNGPIGNKLIFDCNHRKLGLSMQGVGKSTIVGLLKGALKEMGINMVSICMDDLYLPTQELHKVYVESGYSELYKYRGNPGTHDLQPLVQCIEQLEKGLPCQLCKFDKSANEGRGDRVPELQTMATGRESVDLIMIEGWLVGFSATGLRPSVPISGWHYLVSQLHRYERVWDRFVDRIIVLVPPDLNIIYTWRLEQERLNRQGMNTQQTIQFVDMLMPLYENCLPTLLKASNIIMVKVNRHREFTST